MIAWCSSVDIKRPPEAVFDFLANIHEIQQDEGSPVLELELITPGPIGLGSRYREVVQMMPFFKGEMLSTVTAFERPLVLEMEWTGPGMTGRDRYELAAIPEGTTLVHHKWTSASGLLRAMEPMMKKPLFPRLEARLIEIKHLLEETPDLPKADTA